MGSGELIAQIENAFPTHPMPDVALYLGALLRFAVRHLDASI